MYFIGIKGGGAYSRLAAFDSDMNLIGKHAGNSLNLKNISYEKALDNAISLLTEFNRLTNTKLSDCEGLCVGCSGLNSPADIRQMGVLMLQAGVGCPIKAVNDAELVIATETKGNPGIAVISGTSSLAYAVDNDGNRSRSGGWGHLIDDEGSGYWMGMQAIKQALMALDGRTEKTSLTEKIKANFKVRDIEDIYKYIYSDNFNRAQIAELALLVKYSAVEGDRTAVWIEKQTAKALSMLAKSLIEKTGMTDCTVVLSGSVVSLNERIRFTLMNLIKRDYPNTNVVMLSEKAEIGGVYLAMKA